MSAPSENIKKKSYTLPKTQQKLQNDIKNHENKDDSNKEDLLNKFDTSKGYVISDNNKGNDEKFLNNYENYDKDMDPEIQKELNDEYYISERFEISKLSNKIFNKFIYFLVVIILVGYLYIGVTANGIIIGKTLEKTLPQTFDFFKNVKNLYLIVVLIFFFLSILISLNNINKLKSFGLFIMILRVIVILIIFSLCFTSMAKNGVSKKENIPFVNFSNITIMIGNSLFFFMSHHSIPGMVENFYPQKKLINYLILGYVCSLIVMILYGGSALIAFSQFKNCDCQDEFPCAIQVFLYNCFRKN